MKREDGAGPADVGLLTLDDFASRLGEDFAVASAGLKERLTLVEATSSRLDPPAGAGRRAFSLVFLGENRSAWLAQGMFELDHPDFPDLALFLTCIGRAADGRFQYEAVFS